MVQKREQRRVPANDTRRVPPRREFSIPTRFPPMYREKNLKARTKGMRLLASFVVCGKWKEVITFAKYENYLSGSIMDKFIVKSIYMRRKNGARSNSNNLTDPTTEHRKSTPSPIRSSSFIEITSYVIFQFTNLQYQFLYPLELSLRKSKINPSKLDTISP